MTLFININVISIIIGGYFGKSPEAVSKSMTDHSTMNKEHGMRVGHPRSDSPSSVMGWGGGSKSTVE